MTKKQKVKCRLCKRPILKKTAYKYKGYSRQCLQKYEASIESELQLSDYQKELLKLDIKPRFYEKEQYHYIWSIPESNDSYYQKYLSHTIGTLLAAEV